MKIKSYTKIWTIEKMLYAIGDINLPFAMTFSQVAWFVSLLMFMIMFGNMQPFTSIENPVVKYVLIPAGITWFMSKKTFDAKRPYRYVMTVLAYVCRPKITYAGKKRIFKVQKQTGQFTTVRRYQVNGISD